MIERMGGPLVLRYTDDTGVVMYENWQYVRQFRISNSGGMLDKGEKNIVFLSAAEAQQVAAQLDMLVCPSVTHEQRVALASVVIDDYRRGKLTMRQAMELLGVNEPEGE